MKRLSRLILLSGVLFQSRLASAYDVSIFDSRDDSRMAIVEYVTDSGEVHRLVTPKRTLELDYPKIEEWILKLDQAVPKERQ